MDVVDAFSPTNCLAIHIIVVFSPSLFVVATILLSFFYHQELVVEGFDNLTRVRAWLAVCRLALPVVGRVYLADLLCTSVRVRKPLCPPYICPRYEGLRTART